MNSIFMTKKSLRVASLTFLAGAVLLGQALAQDDAALASDKDRLSYALGLDLGNQLRRLAVEIDPVVFGRALGDALAGGRTLMTVEEVRLQIGALQAEMRRRELEARASAGGNLKTGKDSNPSPAPGVGESAAAPDKPR